jgi:alpha-mannosidase
VTLAPDGSLAGVWDKVADREVLAGRGNQLWAYVDKPRSWDAWDIDPEYPTAGEEILASGAAEVIERGPHRVAVRVERRFRDSRIVQEIRLWSNSARLEFKTTLDWHDRRWLLKARFPLAVRSDVASYETAFGVVRRPTHRNTSWDAARFEVAAHRFVDLSEPGYGVALLNDGKYGHDVQGSEVGISLLRSPVYPDPLADEGVQTFTYALYPHAEELSESGVLMEAEDLNRPLLARTCRAERNDVWQALRLEGMPLGLGALKVLEDGNGMVLRVYEPWGRRGSCRLELPEGWRVEAESNLLEEPQAEPGFELGPFQVRSWILRR